MYSKEGIDFWANFLTFLGYRGCATAYIKCVLVIIDI